MSTMNKKSRTVTIPWMGKDYISLLGRSLKNLGVRVQLPPPTTDKTIQIGVRHTAEMVCFPLKPTLGNFAEALSNGADTLLMYDSQGQCRLRHYWKIHEFALRGMGYNFEMYAVSVNNVMGVLKKLSGASYIRILREIIRFYGRVRKIDKYKALWSESKPNIGIIGEMFTCCDERINFGIERKIENLAPKRLTP